MDSQAFTVQELVVAAQRGDERAMERLYARFTPTLRGIAFEITRDVNDAQDVVQETWLRVLQRIGQVRDPACFPGWITVTARREALSLVRRRQRVEMRSEAGPGDEVVCPEAGPAEESTRRDLDARVRDALARLPRDRAALLVETIVRQRPYAEAGRTLGRPTGSLGPLRSRYLAQLRRELVRVGITADDYH